MEESWVLLGKKLMSSSPPPPWWDRVHELQSWRGLLQLLLPPHQQLGQVPPGAASGVLLPPWAVKGGWGGFALGSSCQKDVLAEAASSRREHRVRVWDQWQSIMVSEHIVTCCKPVTLVPCLTHFGTGCCREDKPPNNDF